MRRLNSFVDISVLGYSFLAVTDARFFFSSESSFNFYARIFFGDASGAGDAVSSVFVFFFKLIAGLTGLPFSSG